MIFKYLSFSLALIFISFIVGMIVNSFLKKTSFYNNQLSILNFIKSEKTNRWIGVGIVKWIVKNTPLKFFNQTIHLKNRTEKPSLQTLRNAMTSSEIDHLIAFAFVSIFALVKLYNAEFLFSATIMIMNTLMNLYPSLLQQQNKRRIDKLLLKQQSQSFVKSR